MQDFVVQAVDFAPRPALCFGHGLGQDAGAENMSEQRDHRSAPL
jgi:hypothetical protein